MKILRIGRSGSTGRPVQTRRADAALDAKTRNDATVETCGEDFATGAEERAGFDRAVKASRLGRSK